MAVERGKTTVEAAAGGRTLAKTKKEERDSGFGARSQTTPIGPLLLDAAIRAGEESPDRSRRERVGLTGSRPVAASETFSALGAAQRRTAPGGPNSDSCCGAWRGRAEHRRTLADGGERPGRHANRAGPRDQRRRRVGGDQHGGSSAAAQDQSVAPGAQSGRRRRARRSPGGRRRARAQTLARAPPQRAARAPTRPSRSNDDAPPWQRGRSGGEAERRKRTGGATTWRSFGLARRLTTRCSVARVAG